MVADDSAVIRGLITRTLEACPDIKVVASVPDGRLAVSQIERTLVDVIVLDIEMPHMDGLTAIPKLLALAPQVKIVMASTLTLKNAEISMKALAAGAADYLPKPTSTRDLMGANDFNRMLVDKVRSLGAAARRGGSRDRAVRAPIGGGTGATATLPRVLTPSAPKTVPPMRGMSLTQPRVIAIGSSTGGPQALFQVLKHLAGTNAPILLTQHMPPTFTTILADHITRQCGITAVEATDGMPVENGRIHVAPGDFHMIIVPRVGGPGWQISLNKNPPENFCRPAVDPMLRSIVDAFGAATLAVILTGMGQDGLKGCEKVVAVGGAVIAQDEATSVVWGMPGAVAMAGLCSAVLPISEIGPRLKSIAMRTAA